MSTARHDFVPLTVAEVRRETSEAVSFAFAVPADAEAAFRYQAGQHIVVRTTLDGEEVRRSYSISSGPADTNLWITIKATPGGLFSNWAHRNLRIGSVLDCMPPAGRFVLPPAAGAWRHVISIVAGSGITPVIGILERLLADEPDSAATVIYGNRTVEQIVFHERLEALKNRFVDRLQIVHVLSRDAEAEVPLLTGRIDADKLRAILGGVPPGEGDHVFLCGPDTLIKVARDTLISLGTPRTAIHFEYFKVGPQMAERRTTLAPEVERPDVAGAAVIAVLDGMRRSFRVGSGERVVDAALAAGIRLPFSCKGGMCCTCRAKVLEGQVRMERNFSLEPWELAAGYVLTCQSHPVTPRVVLDYDQV